MKLLLLFMLSLTQIGATFAFECSELSQKDCLECCKENYEKSKSWANGTPLPQIDRERIAKACHNYIQSKGDFQKRNAAAQLSIDYGMNSSTVDFLCRRKGDAIKGGIINLKPIRLDQCTKSCPQNDPGKSK